MKKILIIEDDESLRSSLEEILTTEGFEVLTTSNGVNALEAIPLFNPDLIISDVSMPEMDGYQLLAELAKNESWATTPFIFLTAHSERNYQRKAMELGADDFLIKPFSVDELLLTIDARLKKSDKVRQVSDDRIKSITKSISFSLPHELNTPLSGIIGFSEIMMNEAEIMTPNEVREMAGFINESSMRLKKTIGKYLNYSKLQVLLNDANERRSLLKGDSIISNELVEAVMNKEKFEKNRFEDLVVDLETAVVMINGDYLALLLSELIENALKFSRSGSKVLIKGKKGNKVYWLTVYDKGRGMSSRQLADIGAFVQFNRDMFEQQGSGLGLAIVKNIMSIFEGNVRFSSEPGLGTTVTLELKLNKE